MRIHSPAIAGFGATTGIRLEARDVDRCAIEPPQPAVLDANDQFRDAVAVDIAQVPQSKPRIDVPGRTGGFKRRQDVPGLGFQYWISPSSFPVAMWRSAPSMYKHGVEYPLMPRALLT